MPRRRAFVLMKPLPHSKSRLAGALAPDERELLSLAMLARVLKSILATPLVDEATVVGGDEAVRRLAGDLGIEWREEPASGLNEVLGLLLAEADAGEVLAYLPADLPLLTAEGAEDLLRAGGSGRVAVAPDRHGTGTNALVLPAGSGFRPRFGPDSFTLHVDEARRFGVKAQIVRQQALALDIDTAEDLAELLEAEPDFWQHAEAEVAALDLPASTVATRPSLT
jgi:2-phospho-L-lactate/phosphoenolpyruvate guanylyltransferase